MRIVSSAYFRRTLVLLLAASLLPMIILALVFNSLWVGSTNQLNLKNGERQATQLGTQIDTLASQAVQLGQTCANQMVVKSVLSYLPGQVEMSSLVETMELMMMGRSNQFAMHIVGASHSFSSTELPGHYRFDVFSQTELYSSLNSMPHSSLLFHQPYTDALGHDCILSILTPVYDYHNRLVGYTLVDVYDTAFRELLYRYGNRMEMSLWFDGSPILNTADSELPVPDAVAAMKDYRRSGANGGMAPGNQCCWYWNCGDYNRLYRVFRMDTSETGEIRNSAFSLLTILIVVAGLISAILAFFMSLHQSKPVIALYRAMDAVGEGDLNTCVNIRGKNEIADLGRRFNLLVEQLDAGNKARERHEAELRKQEITALQAQINPHFIYNSLGAARSLIRMGQAEKASEIIGQLSTLLHANFRSIDSFITLREDIELIRCYMYIQNMRFNNRFTLSVDIPEELMDCRLPALILQPIVENAVKHGLEPVAEAGHVWVKGSKQNNDLFLSVEDDGIGISAEMELSLNSEHPESSHVGYLNVRRRIELYYGSRYTATIHRLKQGTCVMLHLPIEKE